MLFDVVVAPVLAIVVAAIAVGLLLTGISALDRLDDGGVARRNSGDLFGEQSVLRRFTGWLLWATPAVVIACGAAWALWGTVGAWIGALAALANMAGIAWLLRDFEMGPNGRRALIMLGWLQIPVGIVRIAADGA